MNLNKVTVDDINVKVKEFSFELTLMFRSKTALLQ